MEQVLRKANTTADIFRRISKDLPALGMQSAIMRSWVLLCLVASARSAEEEAAEVSSELVVQVSRRMREVCLFSGAHGSE